MIIPWYRYLCEFWWLSDSHEHRILNRVYDVIIICVTLDLKTRVAFSGGGVYYTIHDLECDRSIDRISFVNVLELNSWVVLGVLHCILTFYLFSLKKAVWLYYVCVNSSYLGREFYHDIPWLVKPVSGLKLNCISGDSSDHQILNWHISCWEVKTSLGGREYDWNTCRIINIIPIWIILRHNLECRGRSGDFGITHPRQLKRNSVHSVSIKVSGK